MVSYINKYKIPIIFENSFIIFWSIALIIAYICNGIFMCIPILILITVLIFHEFAHLKKCIELNVSVYKVVFSWWGAFVDNGQPKYLWDYIEIVYAGIKNTLWFSIIFLLALVFVYYIGFISTGFNFALTNIPLKILTNTAAGITLVGLSNILPIYFKYKGESVTTDGNFIFINYELIAESWNDGKIFALMEQK